MATFELIEGFYNRSRRHPSLGYPSPADYEQAMRKEAAVAQRKIVHQREVIPLSHVPTSSTTEVAQDLKAIFKVRREKTMRALAEEFVGLHGGHFPKAVSVFEAGIDDALSYLGYPGSRHARIRTTNMPERLFEETKRRTRVVGVFPNEASAATLAKEIALRSSEQWALKRYLTMEALETVGKPNPQLSRR